VIFERKLLPIFEQIRIPDVKDPDLDEVNEIF
jgi:hypothetical protein